MVIGMDGKIVCHGALPSIMGDHGGILKVKGPIKLYENKL